MVSVRFPNQFAVAIFVEIAIVGMCYVLDRTALIGREITMPVDRIAQKLALQIKERKPVI